MHDDRTYTTTPTFDEAVDAAVAGRPIGLGYTVEIHEPLPVHPDGNRATRRARARGSLRTSSGRRGARFELEPAR